MYSSTRSYRSQTDFCIPEFLDEPLILRYLKAEDVLTVKQCKSRKNTLTLINITFLRIVISYQRGFDYTFFECAGLHLVKKAAHAYEIMTIMVSLD